MNKIFKLKKCSHGLKVVSEIAKSHSGEKAVTGSGFGGFGSAFFARLGLGGDTSHGSFSFGKVALSLATAVALSPFMVSEAEALVLCSADKSVTSGNAVGTKVTINKGTLILAGTCPDGYTAVSDSISFNGGTASGTNSIAFNGGIANGTNAFAAMGATANKDNTYAIGNGAITNGDNSMAFGNGAIAGKATTGDYGGTIAIGMDSQALGARSVAIGKNTYAADAGTVAIGGSRDVNTGARAIGTGSIALGTQSVADVDSSVRSGQGNIAIGYLAKAKDKTGIDDGEAGQSIALGMKAQAIGGQATAIGANVIADGYGSIAIGGDDIGNVASSTKSVELNKYISFLGGENAVSERTLLLKAVFSGACKVSHVDGTLVNPSNEVTTCSDLGLVGKEGIYKATNASALGTLAIGQSSIASNTFANAVGFSNIASGIASNAFGTNNIANGDGGNAYGLENKVYDANGTAIGNSNIVNLGAQNSSAIGVSNTIVSGDFSTAIGASNQVTGPKAISIGTDNLNDGLNTLTVGSDNNATEPYAAAVGRYNQTSGAYSTSLGFNNLIEGNHSMAFGEENTITAEQNAVAIGTKNVALSNDTIAMGIENVVSGYHSLALGSDNTVISNEYDEHFGGYSIAIGSNNDIYGPSSFIAGSDNFIDSEDGYSFVGGFENIVENSHSIALGIQNYTTEKNATAIGGYNSITGPNSIAVGYGHQILGSNSGAFGDPTYINSDNSYAIGNNNNIAAGNDSVFILGNNVTNTLGNSVFLGNYSAYVDKNDDSNTTAGMEDYKTNGVKIGNIEAGALTFAGDKPVGVVSVGNATAPRRIQNVAAGLISKDSTDAVNGSQLYYAIEKSTVYSDDRLVFLNNEKNITSPYLHINGVNSHPLTNYAKAIGTDAIAIGKNSEANKTNAVAIGNGSKAGGENSVALMGTKVTGNRAMAWGDAGNQATNWRSTAWGKGTTASGQQATAFGEGTEATKDNSTAWGKNTHAVQNQATAFGDGTTASNYRATAWGQGTEASGSDATAFGVSTKATKNHTTAFGKDTVANADGSTAWGQSTNAGSIFEFVDKNGEKHTVTPVRRVIERKDGLLKEVWVLLKQDGSIVKTEEIIGQHQQEEDYAAATNKETYALNYGKLIEKLTPVKGGNDQTYSTAFGEQTIASGQDSTAFGFRSVATGWSSTAWGHETAALGKRATAFGTETWASANQATAFGYRTEATNENTTAWGSNTKATGTGATAWGSHTKASGDNSTAWGRNSEVYSGSLTYEGKSYTDISIQFELKTKNAENGETYTYTYTDDEGNIKTETKPVQVQYGTYWVQGRNEEGKLVKIYDGDNNWEWVYSGEFDQAHREEVKKWIRNNGGNTAGDYSTAFGDGSKVYAENAVGALGGYVSKEGENSAAIGKDANVSVADTIALGSGSKANRDNITGGKFYKGYDIGTDNTEMPDDATWVATANAIAVGDADNNITRQIIGVAAGSEDTDAVNVAQLKRAVRSSVEANATTVDSANGSVGVVEGTKDGHRHYDLNITDSLENIASIIGGETKYDGNKTIITNNIGDTGKNTIHEAIKAVDKNITVNGWNEANTTDGNLKLAWSDTNNTYDLSLSNNLNLTKDGSDTNNTYDLSLSNNLNLTKDGNITFGDSYINNNEFVVANDSNKTTITPNGLVVNSDGKTLKFTDNNVSVGGNQIHDVAKGIADDDAVNVAQLKEVEANITKVTVNGGVKAPASDYTDGNLQLAWGGDNNNTYDLKLNKNLDLTDGSIKFGDNTVINKTQFLIGTSDGNTTITSDGIVISQNSKNNIQITQSNISMGGNIIHNVGAGVDDTDAVNVSQLKNSIDGNRTRTKITVDGGTEAGKNGAYAGSNLLLAETENKDGNYTFDLKLADKIKIGGGNGEDGNITVAGKDGKDGVSITAADGVGTIGLNGKDGKNATITIGKGKDTLTDKEPGRIIYKTTDNTGKEIELQVATMNDGLKFDGNYQQGTDKAIEKALNDTMTIKGTHTAGADKLSKGNIGVINDGKDLIVELAKDIKLDKGSITITSQDGSKTVNISGDNVDMGGNQIHNVKAGTDDKDAVNLGQLKEYTQDIKTNTTNITNLTNIVGDPGDASKDPDNYKLKTYDAHGRSGTLNTSVVDAISRMNKYGIQFFHTNDGTADTGKYESHKDDASAKGKFSTAIGYKADANGESALAIGNGAQALGKQSIAIGTGNIVRANNAGAFGDPNTVAAGADGSYVIGNNNNITTNDTFVIGNSSDPNTPKVTVANSLFFGNDAAYVADGDRSKGNDKYIDEHITVKNASNQDITIDMTKKFAGGDQVVGVVSVGNGSQTRRIQNVAPGLIGKDSTDAINGSQLYSALDGVAKHLGGQINQTNQAVNNLAQQLGDAKKEYRGGIASAIAIGNLPQSTIPGKGMLSVGTGYYKDQGSLSLGLSKMSDNGKWIFKSSLSYDTQENVGAGLSLGFHF